MRLLCLTLVILLACATASADTIRVGAAISLKEAVTEIAKSYEADTGEKIEFTFGSSGQLQAQIKNGADIDVFISAANKQVDELTKDGLAVAESRSVVAGNALVLVASADAKDAPSSFESLDAAAVRRIAIGEPKTVPAGQYAMQVLTKLRLDEKLADKLVFGTNVRQVLDYVERGEVSAGIVYSTDAKESGGKVRVVATAGAELHEPIVYPAVIVMASKKHDAAKRFLGYMHSQQAKRVLADKGFSAGLDGPATKSSE